MTPAAQGRLLLRIARQSIDEALGQPPAPYPQADWLAQPGATFVTLTQNGELRGCIGTLESWRPLGEDVRENARAAAFRDPRFPPLGADELARTEIEVSLLSAATPLQFGNEAEALAQLRPHQDGLILSCGARRATFLPQVWEQLPRPAQFLAHLKVKAGLPGDYWSDQIELARYQVEKWREQEF
jgi:AmmeMemoRadiSam system protein A